MILKNYYCYMPEAIPKSLCDNIIKEGKKNKPVKAKTGYNEGGQINDKRNSITSFFSSKSIYKELIPFINLANQKSDWNFQWDFCEPMQYTEYKVGQYYNWHADAWTLPYAETHKNKNFCGKIRKLSMTLSLTSPNRYEGGNLEFDLRDSTDYEDEIEKNNARRVCTEIRPKGSVVVFPSFVWHRVTPITKGIRRSLVMWCLGKPFQ